MHASPALLDYVQALVEHTRRSPDSSPACRRAPRSRCCTAARAWALIEGRDKVLPEDVQAVLPGVAGHRLHPVLNGKRRTGSEIVVGLVDAVPVP